MQKIFPEKEKILGLLEYKTQTYLLSRKWEQIDLADSFSMTRLLPQSRV